MRLSDLTHMTSMVGPKAINMKTPMTDNMCSFEKDFIQLIGMNTYIFSKVLVMLIHVTIVYMVCRVVGLKTSCGWNILFLK